MQWDWKEHRSNFFFWLLTVIGGSSVVGTMGHAIANDIHGHPTDWTLFSLFLVVGVIFASLAFRYAPSTPLKVTGEDDGTGTANKLIELGKSINGVLAPLQIDALRLSMDLLQMLHSLGSFPEPKYSAREIRQMPSEEQELKIRANDVDYDEACEFHFAEEGRLSNGPMGRWNERARATYALHFQQKVADLRNRFSIEGFTDPRLETKVEGFRTREHIRAVALALWGLAYKFGEKERINVDSYLKSAR